MKLSMFLTLALLLAGGPLSASSAAAPSQLGLTAEGRLSPCGAAPNCVSSDETGSLHGIEPLAAGSDPQATWQALIDHLESDSSYKVEVEDEGYLRLEARTRLLRFVDDVEFHLRPAVGEIAMRSASRLGFSDLGKNRRRLEAVRRALEESGTGQDDR